MSPVLLFSLAVGGGVATLLFAAFTLLYRPQEAVIEDRLSMLTSAGRADGVDKDVAAMFNSPLKETQSLVEEFFNRHLNLQRILDRADVKVTVSNFVLILLAISLAATAIAAVAGAPWFAWPVTLLAPPIAAKVFLGMKCKRRINQFIKQLPEALDLMSRSLRSGHSLGAGFGLIAAEMPDPIAREFGRCFDEQNLGIPLEEALKNMSARIPNMDLRFMVTSIVLQRQTGGDLVEILEKIAKLVRERFKLAGQIAALTGEGRLSGIVLFMLPPTLFVATYFMNREYIMSLFDEPVGRYMVAFAITMQIIGAFVIRKIIDIKV